MYFKVFILSLVGIKLSLPTFKLWELFNQLLSHYFSVVLFPDSRIFFPPRMGKSAKALRRSSCRLPSSFLFISNNLLCKISFLTSLSSDNYLLNSLPPLQSLFQFLVPWPKTWLQVVS